MSGAAVVSNGSQRLGPTLPIPRLTFQTAAWFLKRPRLYPELWRVVKSSLPGRPAAPDMRPEAENWCAARSISTAAAVARITGSPMPEPVDTKFEDVFAAARPTAETCPVGMGGAADLDLLYWLAEHVQAKCVVETGVAYGWSTLALLLSLAPRAEALLISTDMPYPNRNNDAYIGCVIPAGLRSRWQLLQYADREALPKALKELGGVDLCHYDSDKSYDGKMWAYPLLWKALRPGGIFLSDDIGDDLAFHDFCAEIDADPIIVKTALDFCVKIGIHATSVRKVLVMETKYVGILVKDGNGRSAR